MKEKGEKEAGITLDCKVKKRGQARGGSEGTEGNGREEGQKRRDLERQVQTDLWRQGEADRQTYSSFTCKQGRTNKNTDQLNKKIEE